jgi:heme/copper-type cytochrome/quinol oxidase subunit 2
VTSLARVRWCVGLALLCVAASAPLRGQGVTVVQGDKSFLLRVEDSGKEPRILRAQKGDRVRLVVEASRSIVLHIHGLGVEIAAAPGRPGDIQITMRATGRFPVQVHDAADSGSAGHHHRAPFAYLEVHPK